MVRPAPITAAAEARCKVGPETEPAVAAVVATTAEVLVLAVVTTRAGVAAEEAPATLQWA
jgi:hypothetical protein